MKLRRMRWERHVAGTYWREIGTYRALASKPEGKRPFGSPSRKWEDNIKMGLKDIGWEIVYQIALAQDRSKWRAVLL
jgi:hypothetical protein